MVAWRFERHMSAGSYSASEFSNFISRRLFMFTRTFSGISVVAAGLLVSTIGAMPAALAAFMLTNVDTSRGANTGALDPLTGKIWLDLNQTSGHVFDFFGGSGSDTYPRLQPRLDVGGDLSEFRLATSSEVTEMLTNSGVFDYLLDGGPLPPLGDSSSEAYPLFSQLISVLSIPVVDASGDGCALSLRGYTAEAGPLISPIQGRNRSIVTVDNLRPACRSPDSTINNLGANRIFNLSGFDNAPALVFNPFPGSAFQRVSGYWLVKDAAAVPEPATFGLFSLGLLALVRRRSKG
jgi:hypothetical protein